MPQISKAVRVVPSFGEIGAPKAAAAASRYFHGKRVLAASLDHLVSSSSINGDYWVVALSTDGLSRVGPAPILGVTTAPASPARQTTPYRFAVVDARTSRVAFGLEGRR